MSAPHVVLLRLRLRLAQRAIDQPYTRQASLRPDARLQALERTMPRETDGLVQRRAA